MPGQHGRDKFHAHWVRRLLQECVAVQVQHHHHTRIYYVAWKQGVVWNSEGKADHACPPINSVFGDEDGQRNWLNFEIGEYLLVSVVGEKAVFRTTHC